MPRSRAAAAPPREVGRPVGRALEVELAQRRDVLEVAQLVGLVVQRGARRAGVSPAQAASAPSSEPWRASRSAAVFSPIPSAAGQPVGGVAAQRDEVGHELGRHAVALAHLVGVDHVGAAGAAAQVEHRDRRPTRTGTCRGRRSGSASRRRPRSRSARASRARRRARRRRPPAWSTRTRRRSRAPAANWRVERVGERLAVGVVGLRTARSGRRPPPRRSTARRRAPAGARARAGSGWSCPSSALTGRPSPSVIESGSA